MRHGEVEGVQRDGEEDDVLPGVKDGGHPLGERGPGAVHGAEYTVRDGSRLAAEAPARAASYHEVMRFPRLVLVFLALSWVLVMLYPDPGVLVRSVRNTLRPRVEPRPRPPWPRSLPDDPRAIEAYVLDRQVPYAYDWQSAGVPWYFPTASEALRAGRGDCESRALVLASILTAKGIPNELRMSFDHIWVDYPGKQANALENAGVEFAGRQRRPLLPALARRLPPAARRSPTRSPIFWTPAPLGRVLLLARRPHAHPARGTCSPRLLAGNGLGRAARLRGPRAAGRAAAAARGAARGAGRAGPAAPPAPQRV